MEFGTFFVNKLTLMGHCYSWNIEMIVLNRPHALRTFSYAHEFTHSSDVDRSLSFHLFLLYSNLIFYSISWLNTGTHREYVNVWFDHFSIVLMAESSVHLI